MVKPVVGCKNYWPQLEKTMGHWKELQAYLGGGFKYGLYVQSQISGSDPIWLLFLRWVETTNYSYPRSVFYHTFPPKFELPRPFLPPGSSLVSWHKVVISPMAMDEVERQLSIWCLYGNLTGDYIMINDSQSWCWGGAWSWGIGIQIIICIIAVGEYLHVIDLQASTCWLHVLIFNIPDQDWLHVTPCTYTYKYGSWCGCGGLSHSLKPSKNKTEPKKTRQCCTFVPFLPSP